MRTAQEYQTQIKVTAHAIAVLGEALLKQETSDKPDRTYIKLVRDNIKKLETNLKYLTEQRKKAERIEARESESVSKS